MRRSLVLALAALVAPGPLTACAPGAQPESTATSVPTADPEPAPSPTPTPTPTVVPAGHRPPQVFGGDCAVAVPAEALTAATGISGIVVTPRDHPWMRSIGNVGGLACEWRAEGVSGDVTVLPKRALDGAALPAAEADFYFGACDWGCSWRGESDDLVITGYSSDLAARGRDEADRIGAAITAGIVARVDAAGLNWQLDRAQWWTTQQCDDVAARLGVRLGATVTAQAAGYHDPPGAATALADIASHRTWCAFESDGRQLALATLDSGAAWDVPAAGLGRSVDLTVPGVTSYVSDQGGYLGGQVYEATGGVNAMTVEVATDAPWPVQELATALVAEFVAS
ncbi:hypothetical protein [Microbacterium hibisci]|uniref:hypothetical protein n=1 Tax=Microbacterium hibisci TaxID=2036000 RepID=UPI0019447A62|nr:hypothetical protein [Microbacterium hibisci]